MSFPGYVEALPAGGVNACAVGHVVDVGEWNLVTVRQTSLQLYRLVQHRGRGALELVFETDVLAPVQDVQCVRFADATRDSVLVTFVAAKVAVLDFDTVECCLRTVALHSGETLPVTTPAALPPKLAVDPEGRCAVVPVNDTQLMVLVFRQSTGVQPDTLSGATGVKTVYLSDFAALGIEVLRDVVFLPGFSTPTLAVLAESTPTSYNRLSFKRDTCVLRVLSLDVIHQDAAAIWAVDSLPFDAHTVLACASAIGGCLVVATSFLCHVQQNGAYVLGLNAFADAQTAQPIHARSPFAAQMDAARLVAVADDQFLVSLKTGSLLLVGLSGGSGSNVSIRLSKAGTSVLTSCWAKLGPQHVFFGSRVADSLLIRMQAKMGDDAAEGADDDQELDVAAESAKRVKTAGDAELGEDEAASLLPPHVRSRMDADDLELLRSKASTQTVVNAYGQQYLFALDDTVWNIGPINEFAVLPPRVQPTAECKFPAASVVCAAGYGKSSSLVSIQQSVPVTVRARFPPEGLRDQPVGVFSFATKRRSLADDDAHAQVDGADDMHFLLLCRRRGTFLLQCDTEVVDVTEHYKACLSMHRTTICAGQWNDVVVQVCRRTVKMFCLTTPDVHLEWTTSGKVIVAASIAGPFVALLQRDDGGESVALTIYRIALQGASSLSFTEHGNVDNCEGVALCAFQSAYPLLHAGIGAGAADGETAAPTDGADSAAGAAAAAAAAGASAGAAAALDESAIGVALDDDDRELLSGVFGRSGASASSKASALREQQARRARMRRAWRTDGELNDNDTFCCLASSAGRVLILHLATMRPVFDFTAGVCGGSTILFDQGTAAAPEGDTVMDVFVGRIGDEFHPSSPLVLGLALSTGFVLLYKAFDSGEGALRFRRVSGMFPYHMLDDMSDCRVFWRVKALDALFIAGGTPWWVVARHGRLFVHRAACEAPITCMSDFHNAKCEDGVAYCEGRMCVLGDVPTTVMLDHDWPIIKIPLLRKQQVLHVDYFEDMNVVVAIAVTQSPVLKSTLPEDMQNTGLPIMRDTYELILIDPDRWQLWQRHAFAENEIASYVRVLRLDHDQSPEATPYVVVGIGQGRDEDEHSSGSLKLFTVFETQDEKGAKVKRLKLVLDAAQREALKGAVTCVASLANGIVHTQGAKVLLHHYRNRVSLTGLAFYDCHSYVVDMDVFQKYILVADMYKGIVWLRLKLGRHLRLIAQEPRTRRVQNVGFLVRGGHMTGVGTDYDGNLLCLAFDVTRAGTLESVKLDLVAAMNCGLRTLTHRRVVPVADAKARGVMFGTMEGAVIFVMPLKETDFRLLLCVQDVLGTSVQQFAGCNPAECRGLHKSPGHPPQRPLHPFVDGTILKSFLGLDFAARSDIARHVGASVHEIDVAVSRLLYEHMCLF